MNITVGTRKSPLALVQIDEIEGLLQEKGSSFTFTRKEFSTHGDVDKATPLSANTKDDIFTDQLDQALLNGDIDIAIHSAKDLPQTLADGLMVYALTESLDSSDAFIGNVPFGQLPQGAKIGTSSTYRQEKLRELNPDLTPAPIRGTIQERIKQFKEGLYDGIIVATIALKRLGLEDCITGILPWEGIALQGQLAVVGRQDDYTLRELLSVIDVRKNYGKVYLVGAGPGDPELITLKAIRVLTQADVVFYDYLTHKDILKHAPNAELIYAGKRKGAHSIKQDELNQKIREAAIQGKMVARLKCGDPFVFGRGADELNYLREYYVDVDVIPGISSATGAVSSLGVPLTARDISSSVSFVSAYDRDEQESKNSIRVPDTDTIVFLMGLSKLDQIVDALKQKFKDESRAIAVISRSTWRDEKVVVGTLADIESKVQNGEIVPPCIVLFGDVLRFYIEKSKAQTKILFTGTNPERFTMLGDIIHFPVIQIGPNPFSDQEKQNIIKETEEADAILLTSRFGVKHFFNLLEENGFSIEHLKEKEFYVIGTTTADELIEHDFYPTLMANIETSTGLLDVIKKRKDVTGKKIIFPRSSLPNPTLREELTAMGAYVTEIPIYLNTKLPKKEIDKESIDVIFFTSPSTVKNYLEDYGKIPGHWRILSKGEVTADYLKRVGYKSEILINT